MYHGKNGSGSCLPFKIICINPTLKSMFIMLDGLTEDELIYYKLQPCGHPPVGGCVVCLWISCAATFWAWHNVLFNSTFEAPSHEQYSWLSTVFFLDTLCSFFSCSCMHSLSTSPNILFIPDLLHAPAAETRCLCSLEGWLFFFQVLA